MVNSQATKTQMIVQPTALVDAASWTTVEIDTRGFDTATVYFALGANDIAMTALKVQESATSGSGFADVTGLVFGTSTNTDGTTSALPSATDDDKLFVFDVDLKARERYLDLVATNGNGTVGGYAAAWVVLSRAGTIPMSATERGAEEVLRV